MKYRHTGDFKKAKGETAKLFLHGTIKAAIGIFGAVASLKLIHDGGVERGVAGTVDKVLEDVGDQEMTENKDEVVDAEIVSEGDGS